MSELFTDPVLLARLQFAFTAMFHILWPVLTIGLSLFLVLLEVLWWRTGDDDYYRHARFWSRLLLLNFSVGVVSGIPLQFAFGANWSPFSAANGDFFGNILGFEAAMAFMLEAGFLGIAIFGWHRVPRGVHLFATCMVAVGASLSAFWIMTANAWMQTPAGIALVDGVFEVTDYAAAIFNPAMPTSVAHMWVACLETSLLVIGGISAWYILHNRHCAFFLKSLRLVIVVSLVVMPLQLFIGDEAGRVIAEHQPAKLAAIEAHWHTNPAGVGAPWAVVAWPDPDKQDNRWALEIPNALSLLITHSTTGTVQGLSTFPREDQPPVWLPFYSFRVMVVIGLLLIALAAWSGWRLWRGALTSTAITRERLLLRAWLYALPLGYIAVEMGWITREVGRQPWIIYGLMRTSEGVSTLPAATVLGSLLMYITIYSILLVAFLVFAKRLVRKGPDLAMALPGTTTAVSRDAHE